MSSKNTIIVGMALLGALALLTGTIVAIPTVYAISDPNGSSMLQHCIGCGKTYFDPDQKKSFIPTDPCDIYSK